MKRRHMISFFSVLLLIIITVIIFVILVQNSNTAEQKPSEQTDQQITTAPTSEPSPTAVPTPTAEPKILTELYPVPQVIDDQVKYGYIDKSGEFVISPSFDSASDFNDGAAVVTMNDKYCVIDEGGNVLFINDSTIYDFHNGAALYYYWDGEETSLYGYVDIKGNVIIEPQYNLASDFNDEGYAYVYKGDNNYAVIDMTGKELQSYTLDEKYSSAWSLHDGYLIYSNSEYVDYGVVNIKGEEILPTGFSDIAYLGNDLFAVKEKGLESYPEIMTAKQAIFNASGEQLTDYIYYNLSAFHDGYASASDNTYTYFIGLDGKEVTNLPKYEGSGTLKLLGDVISGEIDGDKMYCTMDNTVIWKTPSSFPLSDTVTVNSLKFRPIRDVLVHYPQIDGLSDSVIQDQINAELYRLFVTSRADVTSEDNISAEDSFSAKLIKNLLIIGRDGYDYYYGAAHGMPIMDFYYIDTTTGVFYQLKDLFIEGSEYATKINGMISDEMNADAATGESMYFPEDFKGIAETQYFMLEDDALVIYFYPYEIAAYAAGFPQFTIPFDDISEFINRDGTFWKSFNE